MTVRKHFDNVKDGVGIDGSKGQDFSKPHGSDSSEWYKTSDHKERSYSPNAKKAAGDAWVEVGVTKMPGMRNVPDFGNSAATRDIYDDVDANSGSGASGPVKYGVNRSQKR